MDPRLFVWMMAKLRLQLQETEMVVLNHSLKGFDDKIISMYRLGMSTRDIQSHLKEMYNIEVSHELIVNATDAVMDEVRKLATQASR